MFFSSIKNLLHIKKQCSFPCSPQDDQLPQVSKLLVKKVPFLFSFLFQFRLYLQLMVKDIDQAHNKDSGDPQKSVKVTFVDHYLELQSGLLQGCPQLSCLLVSESNALAKMLLLSLSPVRSQTVRHNGIAFHKIQELPFSLTSGEDASIGHQLVKLGNC